MVPKPILVRLSRLKGKYSRFRKLSDFRAAKSAIKHRKVRSPAQRLLVYPGDPWTLTGSLGDDAMMTAALAYLGSQHRDLEVHILCMENLAGQLAREKGFVPVPLPPNTSFASDMRRIFENGGYDMLLLVGADIMDGYYSPEPAENMLMAADLAARAGIATNFLGFSFNNMPEPELKHLYDTLHPGVTLNVRDEVSLKRFNTFTSATKRLVADTAFLLKPATVGQRARSWIVQQKSLERMVIGFNVHPMLIKDAGPDEIQRIINKSIHAIEVASKKHDVSWVLIPHDYRDIVGDDVCLKPIYEQLKVHTNIDVMHFGGTHRAATLKALAGHMDGVVTGRMHLAIASLGMGIPTLCITYQDKFEGLYRHFGLPKEFLLAPRRLMADQAALDDDLDDFITSLPQLKAQITQRLPEVHRLAELNFAFATAG
ncbi:polysaccharide pyruvyl transferase family protein [Devosia nitrariae]|nr:polysaccharide pyruvyl transferase family protein [Devosia nitrariae]